MYSATLSGDAILKMTLEKLVEAAKGAAAEGAADDEADRIIRQMVADAFRDLKMNLDMFVAAVRGSLREMARPDYEELVRYKLSIGRTDLDTDMESVRERFEARAQLAGGLPLMTEPVFWELMDSTLLPQKNGHAMVRVQPDGPYHPAKVVDVSRMRPLDARPRVKVRWIYEPDEVKLMRDEALELRANAPPVAPGETSTDDDEFWAPLEDVRKPSPEEEKTTSWTTWIEGRGPCGRPHRTRRRRRSP